MAYDPNELFASASRAALLRAVASVIQPKTFAAGSGILAALTPVAFNTSTAKWVVWSAGADAVVTATPAGTVSGGTFTITVNGQTTAAIAYNAANSVVLAALLLLSTVSAGDIVLTGGPVGTTPLVMSFAGGQYDGQAVTVALEDASITGGGTITVADTVVGGTVALNGENIIKGFVWPDAITLVSGSEVIGNVMLAGLVHYDDIALPGGEIEATLKTALESTMRALGITIQGLAKVR